MESRDKTPPTRPKSITPHSPLNLRGDEGGLPPPTPPVTTGIKQSILLPYQARWVNDGSPLKIWLAARQTGKSFAIAMEAVTEALAVGPGRARCNNMILSASERQSKEVMEKIYGHLRYLQVRSEEVIRAERETRAEVTLPNGSRIISLPASPDTVRGFSGNVFLDEFAFHKDSREIWRAMYPTVTRGYKVRISSTPNGKQNMFYELWATTPSLTLPPQGGGDNLNIPSLEGRDKGRVVWSRHRTDIYEAASGGLKVNIEALRKGIGDPDAWAQEFECAFVDEATAFITYEMIAACEDEGATITPHSPLNLRGDEGGLLKGEFYLGVDIGRKRDLTVFWLLEKVGDVFWTRMVHVMRGATFAAQRDFLYGLMNNLPSPLFRKEGNPSEEKAPLSSPLKVRGERGGLLTVRCACIDSTGIGAQLAEEAAERFGSRVEAVLFTGRVKEDLAITLRRRFEDRLLRIPADREIREDIHSVKKTTTSAGNVRFDAERTEQGHADRFWALALALHAGSAPAMTVEYERILRRDAKPKEAGCW